jgi:hypothetical protein
MFCSHDKWRRPLSNAFADSFVLKQSPQLPSIAFLWWDLSWREERRPRSWSFLMVNTCAKVPFRPYLLHGVTILGFVQVMTEAVKEMALLECENGGESLVLRSLTE